MIPTLRKYQVEAVDQIKGKWRDKIKNILLTAPARSGKTTIFCFIALSAVNQILKTLEEMRRDKKPYHVLVVAARRDLIKQASKRLDAYEIEHGIIMAGDSRNRPERIVQVASIHTLKNRPEWEGRFKLIIIDECHASSSASYQWLIKSNPQAFLLGFTATPFRTDGKPLGKDYGEMIKISTVKELVGLGYLVPYRAFCPFIPDTSAIRANSEGEYSSDDLAAIMDKPGLVGDIVDHWQRIAGGRQTIVYASTVAHSNNIVAKFMAAGIKAAHIDSHTPNKQRDHIKDCLMHGRLTIVCNVGIWTEGVDVPSVSCIIAARPTASRVLYIQAASRGMGNYTEQDEPEIWGAFGEKENMILLDHAGWTNKFSTLYDQDIDELDREGKKKKKQPLEDSDYIVCPNPACCACHLKAPTCPECGHIYDIPATGSGERETEQIDGELKEVNLEEIKIQKKKELKAARTEEQLIELARRRDYKSPEKWAKHQLEFRAAARQKYIAEATYKRWGDPIGEKI